MRLPIEMRSRKYLGKSRGAGGYHMMIACVALRRLRLRPTLRYNARIRSFLTLAT